MSQDRPVDIETKVVYSADGYRPKLGITASIDRITDTHMVHAVMHEICRQIAERYVAENYQEIAAKLDQQAIATISVAHAGVKIREALEEAIPKRVETIVKTVKEREVYQRGIFGGVRRVL